MIPLALALMPLVGSVLVAPKATVLENPRLTTRYGDRGLVSIASRPMGSDRPFAPISFDRDDFAIAIDGREYDSAALPDPTRTSDTDRVTYRWTAGTYQIDVTYQLAPDWGFVTKQIRVTSALHASHHVERVTVFRSRIGDLDVIQGAFVPGSATKTLGTGEYGEFLRFGESRGLLAAVQNPFLHAAHDRSSFSIGYEPDMDWRQDEGPFVADRGVLAPYRRTGRVLPEHMVAEWKTGSSDATPGADEAEIATFTDVVRASLLYRPARPLNVFVGWCVNDYQIDAATPEGRAEYTRVIDRAAALGAEYVLYAPSNSALSRREESVDDWSWEHVLWLGLGQKLRKGEWDPARDAIPSSVQEMLEYARAKHVKLLAYVYPVLPFAGDPGWLVPSRRNPARKNASLGNRAWQDHLIELLVAFHDRTGIGGFSFDHTFLTYDGASKYAQWAGWRRVMEELRRRMPDLVVDGRQQYHLYGPWSWLAGSYPHPTFNDEQPESFTPFPDLHFDRVSADRERFTAYRYRNYEFAPSEIVPGFIAHQTPRNDDAGRMPETRTPDRGVVITPIRARDWDYLGWRYSLLSSIAIAGWNNVLNMIPARDLEEDRHFTDEDTRWFRQWIDWTNTNKEFLRHTRTILGQPALGRIDGTSAIVGDRGYLFFFNPNARRLTADVTLDASIGLERTGRFLLTELYPLEHRLIGKPGAGVWTGHDRVSLTIDGGSALVLALSPAPLEIRDPLLLGVPGQAALGPDGALRLTGVRGEAGSSAGLMVVLPPGGVVKDVTVNDRVVAFSRPAPGMVAATVRFAGAPFSRLQPAIEYNPEFAGGTVKTTVTIPARVVDQLHARAAAWPIPWTAEDYRSTWLAPERLLLFAPIAEPDDRWEARLKIDGQPIELRKAYSAIAAVRSTFVGFYADVSLLSSDRPHDLELELPPLKRGQFQGLFFENIEPEYTTTLAKDRQ